MKPAPTNWMLVLRQDDRTLESFKLAEGTTTIGREPSNTIALPSSNVSRQHAEIVCSAEGVRVRDLGSRNGILVNGVPRKRAALQPGDRITICEFVLELALPAEAEMLATVHERGLAAALRLDQTVDQRVRLPEARHERELVALYHVCFWVADGLEEKSFVERCLSLLLEAFRATEVHLYSAELELQAFVLESGSKPAVKLASFLARQFQEAAEAMLIRGTDIARHQKGVGEFNYLAGPLRSSAAAMGAAPFLVVVRPAAHEEFTVEDRVLLQAICQLWVRGLAKTTQLQQLRQEITQLKEQAGATTMLGSSAAIKKLQDQARKAAATHATILLTGETGSGKELLAQFIHEHSPRRAGPLVKMNCAAIPDSLIESELFGYAKGAFSGAVHDHNGKFVQANGGTLFLDEISEMPLLVQAKVLRAIENREVTPLGSERTVPADLRIVAATNQNLRERVRQRQFREDLYFRLNVLNLHVPPLREHAEDIPELAHHFLKRFSAENGLADLAFAPEALAALQEHAWPGNVRELWNVVQRCALAAEGPLITEADVRGQLQQAAR